MIKGELDALLELERISRVLVYQTTRKEEMELFKRELKVPLEYLAKLRENAERLKQLKNGGKKW